ncbi:MAG: hypothetical protein E6H09_17960 [Bacteroidetes bacterium]|jgi:hypothetical protein|nr:MAG: hypothetical protein E6H09_17960 [Bacteroidota bacterium]
MNSHATLHPDLQKQAYPAIPINTGINRPADLLGLISNPPAILYASPVSGMIILLIHAGSIFSTSFLTMIRCKFKQVNGRN